MLAYVLLCVRLSRAEAGGLRQRCYSYMRWRLFKAKSGTDHPSTLTR